MKVLDLNIDVPVKLKNFMANPTPALNGALSEADRETLTILQVGIKGVIHSKSGQLARSVRVDLPGRKVFSTSPYAKAYQSGHYAEPVNTPKKMFLRFNDQGKEVFIRYTRSGKNPFFFETLDKNRLKIRQIYDRAFEKMLRSI